MKILHVNCVYNTGSTGKIMCCVHQSLLDDGYDSVVCYGRGAKTNDAHVYKTCGELYSKCNNLLSRFTGIMYGGCFFSTNRLLARIRREKPDVVHLHCINGYFVNIYRLIAWLKKNKIKTVLTLHAEFMHTGNCGHAYACNKWKTGCGKCPVYKKETKSLLWDRTARAYKKMKKAFAGFGDDLVVTSVSPWLMDRAKQSPILKDKHHLVVLNGLDTDIFHPRQDNRIKEELHIPEKKMVLHVTPSFVPQPGHIKGGNYVVELAKQMPDTVFVVVGSEKQPDDLPDNVKNIGRLEDQNRLAEFYTAADVTLLTSRRETFSMVTAESLCCGTYVAGFEAGAPEMITIPAYSSFVPYGNTEALKAALEHWMQQEKAVELPQLAAEKYDKRHMYEGFLSIYKELSIPNENR